MAGKVKIKIEDLHKYFERGRNSVLKVLRGVDMRIHENEFVSIIGPSGCGKTTFLNIVAGLSPPTSGRVLLDGKEVSGPGRERGMVFQQDAIFMWRKVIENVEFGLELRGISKQKRREIALKYLKIVKLEKFSDFYPKELSGGMRKKVALAMVFANDPEVLLMDEPFGSLDYPTKITLQRELLEIWEHNKKTTLFVTHDLEEALFLSTYIIVLRDGRVAEIFNVPFEWPRTDELRVSQEIQESKNKLWKYLQ